MEKTRQRKEEVRVKWVNELHRPIAFASKALTCAQAKYPAHRLEFLALKWSVCEKFSHWLKGHEFVVWTDNNPLTYILTKPKLDACEQRWVSKLAPYRFSIKYIPGSKNVVADALSRQPFVHNRVSQRLLNEPYNALLEEAEQFEKETVQDAFRLSAGVQSVECPPCVMHCPISSAEVSAVLEGHNDWEAGRILKQWDKLKILDGLLYRVTKDNLKGKKRLQYVVPSSLITQVMTGVHDEQGTRAKVEQCTWIHSDQGANFESQLIRELLQVAGVKKSRTTAYHPMGNGLVERFNRTLGSMIRALPPRSKEKWSQLLQTLTFAYNCTAHESTGYAPFYLMFGRIPKLPVDVMFGNVERDCDVVDYNKYVKRLKDDLKEALTVAQKNIDKGECGKRKLADRWESTPYRVVALNPQCHIYRIRNTKTGQDKTVHRILLLQANFLPLELEEPESSEDSGESVLSSRSVSMDVVGPVSDLCSLSERVASWLEKTTASDDPQQRLSCRSESVESLNVVPESSGQEQLASNNDCTKEKSNVSSPDEGQSSDSHSSVSEAVCHSDHCVSPVEAVEPPPDPGEMRVRTRVGRIVKPVNRLIENMTQSIKFLNPVGGVVRSLLDKNVLYYNFFLSF
ncbi:uncharacterized protein LOC107699913 [Sinocyclocheilus anshuiensis]|uniref:uncharacterized protein LOC107699913 n=1 Tax=Sinocyclocheilus anshuiensis TaxID=1608454 RepID=UPI0007BA071C|nr:PREDICTED: uncharacterized protein LOC107699913 [Sinocyclocheilus anshuiensis]